MDSLRPGSKERFTPAYIQGQSVKRDLPGKLVRDQPEMKSVTATHVTSIHRHDNSVAS